MTIGCKWRFGSLTTVRAKNENFAQEKDSRPNLAIFSGYGTASAAGSFFPRTYFALTVSFHLFSILACQLHLPRSGVCVQNECVFQLGRPSQALGGRQCSDGIELRAGPI